jgi:hypothetical protein
MTTLPFSWSVLIYLALLRSALVITPPTETLVCLLTGFSKCELFICTRVERIPGTGGENTDVTLLE